MVACAASLLSVSTSHTTSPCQSTQLASSPHAFPPLLLASKVIFVRGLDARHGGVQGEGHFERGELSRLGEVSKGEGGLHGGVMLLLSGLCSDER